MDYVALGQEPYIRLGVFGGVLFAMAIWELFAPRRKQAIGRSLRWPNNLGVAVVDTLLVRLHNVNPEINTSGVKTRHRIQRTRY